MKKLMKLTLKAAVAVVVLGIVALVALRFIFPPEKLKTMAQNYAKNNLHREISFDGVSFNLIGITLDNFALSEENTFEQGTFLKANKLEAKVAFWPLFKKRIEVSTVLLDGLSVNIVKQKNGSFNFDSLIPAAGEAETATLMPLPKEETAQQTTGAAFALLADKITISDCTLSYKDEQTGMQASIDKLNLQINNFDLQEPFNLLITFTTELRQVGGPAVSIPVTLDMTVSLGNLDMNKAHLTANQIAANYKTVQLQLAGDLKNFSAPQAHFSGSLKGINNTVFAELLPDLPQFDLPVINLNLQATADLEKGTASIKNVALSVQDSSVSAAGNLNWGGRTPTYNFGATIKADLSQLVKMTTTMDGFQPGGKIEGSFKATDKNNGKDLQGTVTLKDLSLLYPPFTASGLNGKIILSSLDDISCSSLTGLLNGEKFKASFSYKNIQEVMNLFLNLDLAKFKLDAFPSSSSDTAAPAEATPQEAATQPLAEAETFMNIKANVQVGEVDIPYFRTEGITLKADLTNVSASMAKTNGQMSFILKPGAITDLDTVIKENKIIKILLLPISVVNKVAGMLNINLFSNQNNAANKGEISFTGAEGLYTFTNGIMKLDKTAFASKVTNLNGTGNINFVTQALDMKVSATVLTSQTPIVIKIGGTLDKPSGKLDVINTVTSVVGGILNYKTPGKVVEGTASAAGEVAKGAVTTAGNTVKGTVNMAKDTLKSIGSLFKKQDTSSEAAN